MSFSCDILDGLACGAILWHFEKKFELLATKLGVKNNNKEKTLVYSF